MNKKLTEEEMRDALFGHADVTTWVATHGVQVIQSDFVTVTPAKVVSRRRVLKAFVPRIRVTLQVGNVFEGEMYEIVHEADTLSTLLAEQEATRVARKKFKYVEVTSVKSV